MEDLKELRQGFETAYIDGNVASSSLYQPQFVSNNYQEGKTVLSSIEDELLRCDQFMISVAFITWSGIISLLQTLEELEKKGIPGKILTTNYLSFSEPRALEKLHHLQNIELRMYDTEKSGDGFHTKGYIFKNGEVYRIIIGSSNLTMSALKENREWNTKIVSTEQGSVAADIVSEFETLWESPYTSAYDDFYETYAEKYEIIRHQRELIKKEAVPSITSYKLTPNKMQTAFIVNLRKIIEAKEDRALLISATGTGKTYASAFAMRELGFRRVLFLVHRGELARQTKRSYERVFGSTVTMGLVGGESHDYDADYVFATIQTMNRFEHLSYYQPDAFDCIILDEAHHSTANSYQKVMAYFKPRLWLGMTATPDKMDDNIEGRNVYELFHHQMAYEIRLQQAMEENLLCPFHYFGISDIAMPEERDLRSKKLKERDFNSLTSDERLKHIVEKIHYYEYSGDRVKGLVFCSRIDESIELSHKFNQITNPKMGRKYRTIALNGSASSEERQNAFERLAMREEDATEDCEPLDYIFSVEILNEGVDIVEVNQVIMLRPTQSPIVFIQQLGRGLRKADGKEFVVILDFIGNYNNNFMIPVALSGDRTYNKDTIRRYVISGNNTIPGASTIHFDEVARERIFHSIDQLRGMKSIIRESYTVLKNRLGRVPYLLDFYESGEVDPLVIIREYKSYSNFLETVEKERNVAQFTEDEKLTLEYLSKTVLSGVRPHELEILRSVIKENVCDRNEIQEAYQRSHGCKMDETSFASAIDVLQGHFVVSNDEFQKYMPIDMVEVSDSRWIRRRDAFARRLRHVEFYKQLDDIIEVGLRRYANCYDKGDSKENPFVLYEKYSRRDVCHVMNCERDLSSTMYGMKRIEDDVFIFVTYHKEETADDQEYVEGKPDYADAFEDNVIFRWDSKIGMGMDSAYVKDVRDARKKHLLVKKSDAEMSFYYMGQFDVMTAVEAEKKDNKGNQKKITKFEMRMHHPVRDDLLRYLQSSISE